MSEVSLFLEGDGKTVGAIRLAIEAIVKRFHLSGGRQQDLVQEALGRVFLSLAAGRFRGESSLKTYAESLARYTCLEHLRTQHRMTGASPDDLVSQASWSAPEDLVLREEEHSRNLRAFASLPAACRQILYLVFVERLSYLDVAKSLGITESALRLRVHRCRLMAKKPRSSAKRGPPHAHSGKTHDE